MKCLHSSFLASLILLLSIGCSTSQQAGKNANGNGKTITATTSPVILGKEAIILEDKLQQGIDVSAVKLGGLSAKELRFLQHVPEARYGKPFDDDAELRAFFLSRPWYRPNPNYDGSMLSQTDVHNYTWVQLAADNTQSDNEQPLGRPHLPDEAQNTPTPNPFDIEGQKMAKQYWDKYLIKCGSSYFYQPNGYVVEELRDEPHFSLEGGVVQPKQLSRADELNGIDPLPVEWEAVSMVEFDAVKEHREEGSYGWQTGTNTRQHITIRRTKGKWGIDTTPREIKCEQMLKLK